MLELLRGAVLFCDSCPGQADCLLQEVAAQARILLHLVHLELLEAARQRCQARALQALIQAKADWQLLKGTGQARVLQILVEAKAQWQLLKATGQARVLQSQAEANTQWQPPKATGQACVLQTLVQAMAELLKAAGRAHRRAGQVLQLLLQFCDSGTGQADSLGSETSAPPLDGPPPLGSRSSVNPRHGVTNQVGEGG